MKNRHNFLKKHPFILTLFRVIKNYNNREYLVKLNAIEDDPSIVKIVPGTANNMKQPICIIEAGTANEGFFACVRWALDGIYFCDKFGFIPIIKFPDKSLYYDETMSANVFEYYFNQPYSNLCCISEECSRVEYSDKMRKYSESGNGGISYEVSNDYKLIMAEIMAKYIKFNNRTQQYINKLLKESQVSSSVLGVHIRGTDYKGNYNNHPIYIEPKDYYTYIDNTLSHGQYKKIFIATDDKEILSEFIEHYGTEKVIYTKNINRGFGLIGSHFDHQKCNGSTPYQKGLEVIGDMCLLSSCGGIISGMSQVALIARIYKISKNEKFLTDITISKGINNNYKKFKVNQ